MSDKQTQPGDVHVGTNKVIPVRQWWAGEAEKHIQKQMQKAEAEGASPEVIEAAEETDADASHTARKTKK